MKLSGSPFEDLDQITGIESPVCPLSWIERPMSAEAKRVEEDIALKSMGKSPKKSITFSGLQSGWTGSHHIQTIRKYIGARHSAQNGYSGTSCKRFYTIRDEEIHVLQPHSLAHMNDPYEIDTRFNSQT